MREKREKNIPEITKCLLQHRSIDVALRINLDHVILSSGGNKGGRKKLTRATYT